MRAVIQRVSSAACQVGATVSGAIENGLLILLGVEAGDTADDASWMAHKIVRMRIFGDQQGLMNQSILDTGGDILLISQFTLLAQTKRGNRPSFIRAAKPDEALLRYQEAIRYFGQQLGKPVAEGVFGADMKVALTNDGPVTILLDTHDKDRF